MKTSQTHRILQKLKNEKVVTNADLNKIAFRYSARIQELRKEGHIIVTDRVSEGLFKYVYKGHHDDKD